jgi:hypothetical protein
MIDNMSLNLLIINLLSIMSILKMNYSDKIIYKRRKIYIYNRGGRDCH